MPPMGCNWSQRKGYENKEDGGGRRRKKKQRHSSSSSSGQSCVSSSGNGNNTPRNAAGMSSGGGGQPSSVSPAAAAASSSGGRQSPTEPLKLGSLTETWKQKAEWNKYVMWLDKAGGEGEDSDGRKMSLARYARFLELYVQLDQAERVQAKSEDEIRNLTLSISKHEEDFFGIERCLRCIDRGMRSQVLDNVRRVRKGETKGGTWVYQPVYPRVVDKLNDLLGPYNKSKK